MTNQLPLSARRRFLPTSLALLWAGALLGMTGALTLGAATSFASPVHKIAAAFTWAGTYDLVGNGFPDGERNAVMHIARADTSYTLETLQGPPGTLVSFKVAGDSAHVVWNLGNDQMYVNLRGVGDSLTGEWATAEWQGHIRGARRR